MSAISRKSVSEYTPETPLERKIAEALKAITLEEGRKKPKLAKIQLQFPKAAAAFKAMKGAFEKYDVDKDGTIDLEEITNALKDLGDSDSFAEEEVRGLFDIADSEGSQSLTFPAFVVFLCLSSLLGHLTEMKQINAAFRCAVDAFEIFDHKNSSVIVFSELQDTFSDGSVATPDILMARMEELDKDGNGYVTFPEFLEAFMDWVGVDDDDED
mmetsp:Transcript_10942/g.16831  ORF Transcript_10942/g.16831 Transcript_10942/m.16831 type:complete len:213 (+) Transcript_10942:182-820(+)|eukprot:CAMPEP_0178913592 /NCGR_PEP_ID=MMETSP0786-20121207/10930_1 /TAXON_ID=186022 /ORGANISM="Thalassionema frauenfeldii, Strain CCMP 1798" /LENGTH=212 /DNA_ID=CAMNT_0020586355 /DNA_START=240 /DNA_END=878 /DNA_ORIENTATION=+